MVAVLTASCALFVAQAAPCRDVVPPAFVVIFGDDRVLTVYASGGDDEQRSAGDQMTLEESSEYAVPLPEL